MQPETEAANKGLDLVQIMINATPIAKGVFALLVLCSVLSVAVIIERYLVISRAQRATFQALEELENWGRRREWDRARAEINRASRSRSPLLAVLRAGTNYWEALQAVGETRVEVMEALVLDAVNREIKLVRSMLRANLPILANIASVAPFIGLFGTVVGIISTFDAISRTGSMGQDLVASGIADALVATAMGLFAAIPAVVAYNYFTDKAANVCLSIEEVALERIYFLVQRNQDLDTTHLRS